MAKTGRHTGVRIDEPDVRRLLTNKSPRDLTAFILKGMKENKAFRRKALAWIIDSDAADLPDGAALGEVLAWIADVFEMKSVHSRPPDLRELNPVKAAVKNRPDLAVPAYIAIVQGIANFLDSFGGGPESYYDALCKNFGHAARYLPHVQDDSLKRDYLQRMEALSEKSSDFGYGVDGEIAAALEEVWIRVADDG